MGKFCGGSATDRFRVPSGFSRRLADAQNRVRGSQEALNGAVKAGFDDTAKALDAVVNIIQPALNKIKALEGQLADLRSQVSLIY